MLLMILLFMTSITFVDLSRFPTNSDRNETILKSATTITTRKRPISASNETLILDYYFVNKSSDDLVIISSQDAHIQDDGKEPCHSHLFFIIIYGPLFGIVCGVGILGNFLSFAVLHADPPTSSREQTFRPRLVDQFSMEVTAGDLSRHQSRDMIDQQPCSSNCCCCVLKRKAHQRNLYNRNRSSYATSTSLVTISSSKPANIKSIISSAILKRVTNRRQSSHHNIRRGVRRRIKGQSVSSYLLKALAITDNVYLATSAFVQIYSAVAIYFGREKEFEKIFYYLQKFFWPVNYLAQLGTVWMMVLVAANRYIAVCKPLHASRLCTKSKVRRQIFILGASLIVYNIPRFFEFDYRPAKLINGTNSSENQELINYGLVTYPLYNILYENVAYCIVAFFLPLLILVFFNVRLMATLRSAEKFRPNHFKFSVSSSVNNSLSNNLSESLMITGRQGAPSSAKTRFFTQASRLQKYEVTSYIHGVQTTEHATESIAFESSPGEDATSKNSVPDRSVGSETKFSNQVFNGAVNQAAQSKTNCGRNPVNADERNVTLVMIIIIIAFIICETPAATNQILFYLVDREARMTCSPYMRFYHISNLLIVLNSALNFFIYFLFRRKFQTQLWSLICRMNGHNNPNI